MTSFAVTPTPDIPFVQFRMTIKYVHLFIFLKADRGNFRFIHPRAHPAHTVHMYSVALLLRLDRRTKITNILLKPRSHGDSKT
jgi:hypothetical protein